MITDLLNLLFPPLCVTCEQILIKEEQHLCFNCRYTLPETNYPFIKQNPVEKLFWGKQPIACASAFLHFEKGEKVQKLLHKIKYQHKTAAAKFIGREYGRQLKHSARFSNIDYVIPVPLHKKRFKERGYNQCTFIAQGIAEELEVPMLESVLIRNTYNLTQTSKSRFDRWSNVQTIFEINNRELISNRHILLVDDVITTGATLEACAAALLANEKTVLSIAALACA